MLSTPLKTSRLIRDYTGWSGSFLILKYIYNLICKYVLTLTHCNVNISTRNNAPRKERRGVFLVEGSAWWDMEYPRRIYLQSLQKRNTTKHYLRWRLCNRWDNPIESKIYKNGSIGYFLQCIYIYNCYCIREWNIATELKYN